MTGLLRSFVSASALLAAACGGTGSGGEAGPAPSPAPAVADVSSLPEGLDVGMRAPDFEATDVAGKSFKLSDYRGKVVLLDFWGFW